MRSGQPPPHRVVIKNNLQETLQECSSVSINLWQWITVNGDDTIGSHWYAVALQNSAQYIPTSSKQITATPGWAIPVGKFGWGYVANKQIPFCARCLNYGAAFTWGLAPNSTTLMPCIPDLRPVGRDWIDYDNYLLWFVEVDDFCYGHARAASAMQTSYAQSNVGLAHITSQSGGAIYDGTYVLGDVTLPEYYIKLQTLNLNLGGNSKPLRFLNIQEDQTFRFFVDKKKGGMPIFADSIYFDDPVGTIKIWTRGIVGSYIPPGWRLCDGTGGTIDLRGRFVMGVNTAVGTPQNEATIASTGGYRYHGYSENQHHKTIVAVGNTGSTALANIDPDEGDDTDNRPRYYVIAYIQRVEPWTQAS